jgi:hypothetical protein
MSVFITLPLFFKPAYELGEGSEVTGDQIRQLGQELSERLHGIADLVDKLTAAGWQSEVTLYDVMLGHPFLHTADEVRAQLDGLGIDPDRLNIDEFEDEEDELDMDEEEFGDDEEELGIDESEES